MEQAQSAIIYGRAIQLKSFLTIKSIRVPAPGEKPKFCYCWYCGQRLSDNKFRGVTLEDGYERVLHVSCTERFKERNK
jgi:hypothetical protein